MFYKNIIGKNSHLNLVWLFSFWIFGISVLMVGCSEAEKDQQILAEVNDDQITVSDFEQDYVAYLIKTGRNDTKEERYRYLNEMIDNLAMADVAMEKGYLSNQTYQDAVWYQKRKSLADLYFVDRMNDSLEIPSDEEVRKAFAKSKRKVYVRHLFSKDEDKLYTYYQMLEQGEDFVDVANEFYNTQEYDSTAGYLGPITYFGIDENFAETAFSLNEGEYSKPIRTSFGYHIVYVEIVIREAMLIESEYQVRKEGIGNKLRQRKQALIASSYIRDLMGKLDVQMNREILISLMNEIQNLPSVKNIEQENTGNQESGSWDDNRLEELSLEVDRESVLGNYVLLGERQEFTVQDYLDWLPYLPLDESRNRTGASVGRALRNEVLMQLSQSEGYESDERLDKLVKKRGKEVLSDLYQQSLIQEALQDSSDLEIPENFKRKVINSRSYKLETTYWKIPSTSQKEAELIRKDLAGGAAPQRFPNYTYYEEIELNTSDGDYSLVNEAQLNSPVVTKSNQNQWAVLNVINRDFVETSSDSTSNDLERIYRVYSYLDQKVDSIRSASSITINRDLFDKIYEL